MKTEGLERPIETDCTIRDGGPDWTVIQAQLACPLCGYNLRGLIEPRCPECGYQFIWSDLLNPSRKKHPYLFEHHSRRPIRSFVATAFHGLRPIKFWRSVRPEHDCDATRLLGYGFMVLVVCFVAMASNVGFYVVQYNAHLWGTSTYSSGSQFRAGRQSFPPAPAPTVRAFSFEWPGLPDIDPLVLLLAIVVAWPVVTILSLHLLRMSMRQAKLKSVHILRCVTYSWDIVLWASIALCALNLAKCAIVAIEYGTSSRMMRYAIELESTTLPLLAWCCLLPIFFYRMVIAYRTYLRFRHAVAVVFTTQLIVGLVVVVVVTYLAFSGIFDRHTIGMIFAS